MTQEEKELLLKDLCARLPYGVKVAFFNEDLTHHSESITLTGIECINNLNYSSLEDEDGNTTIVEFVKPYLFPLSSMSEEQKQEYTYIMNYISPDDTDNWKEGEFIYVEQFTQLMHFYHINHLDYRGLIHMGLAEDATRLNIY